MGVARCSPNEPSPGRSPTSYGVSVPQPAHGTSFGTSTLTTRANLSALLTLRPFRLSDVLAPGAIASGALPGLGATSQRGRTSQRLVVLGRQSLRHRLACNGFASGSNSRSRFGTSPGRRSGVLPLVATRAR